MKTLQDVDRALTDWRTKVNTAGSNILDLHMSWVYQLLNGPPPLQLTGRSESEVTPALAAMATVWANFGLLKALLDECDTIRAEADNGLIGKVTGSNDDIVKRINEKLTGQSVKLPAKQIPRAQRGLLDAAETDERISPSDLLTAAVDAYAKANKAVGDVEDAWDRLGELTKDPESEIVRLQALAVELREESNVALLAAKTALTSIQAEIRSNPLEAAFDLDSSLLPALANARTVLDGLQVDKQVVVQGLAGGPALFAELEALNTELEEVLVTCREKVSNPSDFRPQIDQELIAQQRDWLTRLQSKVDAGDWKPVKVGIVRWQAAVNAYITHTKEALAANNETLEKRGQLRGLLDALKAKARACGLAEIAMLAQLSQEAKTAAWARPTDLVLAETLIREYETRIGLLERFNRARNRIKAAGQIEDSQVSAVETQVTPLLSARPSDLTKAAQLVSTYEARARILAV